MSDSPPRRWPFPIGQAEPLLVVDDHKTMVELTRRVLSRLGFENIDDASVATKLSHSCERRSINWSSPTCVWPQWVASNS